MPSYKYDPKLGPIVEITISAIPREEFQEPRKLKCVVDSGSTISAINKTLPRNLGLREIDVYKDERKIETAGGKIEAVGYRCEMKLEGLKRPFLTQVVGIEHIDAKLLSVGISSTSLL